MRIINFHGVGHPERNLESGEEPFWLTIEQFRDLLDRIAYHPDRHNLGVTFDDGNRSDLVIALPELLERGLSASFFILTGRLDQPGSLRKADVAELHACGMQIGSHGIGHADLKTLSPQQLTDELTRSKSALEDICCAEVNTFAIPFGRYNAAVLQSIRRVGFLRAYTSDGGSASESSFLQPRRSVRGDMESLEIEWALAGHLSPLRRLRRTVSMQIRRIV